MTQNQNQWKKLDSMVACVVQIFDLGLDLGLWCFFCPNLMTIHTKRWCRTFTPLWKQNGHKVIGLDLSASVKLPVPLLAFLVSEIGLTTLLARLVLF